MAGWPPSGSPELPLPWVTGGHSGGPTREPLCPPAPAGGGTAAAAGPGVSGQEGPHRPHLPACQARALPAAAGTWQSTLLAGGPGACPPAPLLMCSGPRMRLWPLSFWQQRSTVHHQQQSAKASSSGWKQCQVRSRQGVPRTGLSESPHSPSDRHQKMAETRRSKAGLGIQLIY